MTADARETKKPAPTARGGGAWKGAVTALIVFVAAAYFAPRHIPQARDAYDRISAVFFPCSRPQTWSIDRFDGRFKISREEFAAAVKEAEENWERSIGRDLFTQVDSGGALTVSLTYDHRQEATEKLRELGIVIGADRKTYDDLRTRHYALAKQVEAERAALEADRARFEARKAAYSRAVDFWNKKGGAPPAEYEKLEAERGVLDAEAERLNAESDALNALIDRLNAMVTVINRLAKNLNLAAATYNDVIETRGEEFDEGLFKGNDLTGTIDIYEFASRTQLVRVLAHELGHALGLEHVDDPAAIMYRLNQGENEEPSATDIEALKQRCGIE